MVEGKSAGRNVPVAIATGVALGGLILGTLYTSRVAWDVVVIVTVTIGCWEFFNTVQREGYKPAVELGLVACAVMMAAAAWRGMRAVTLVLVLMIISTFLWYLADSKRKNVLANVAVSITGVCYTALLGAHVVMMRDLKAGPSVTIAFMVAVVLYDVGAYAFGYRFGKHKIAPSISPAKTWEGAIGATVVVIAAAAIALPFFGRWTLGSGVALAGATAIGAPLGDLAESLLKRDLGIKDFGRLLPGHGGVLDRIDALLIMAPVAYWIARAAGA
ncbi:MAG: phosphatidate cytidylyltransferase [Actinomycetota bacterium]